MVLLFARWQTRVSNRNRTSRCRDNGLSNSLVLESKIQSVCSIPSIVTVMLLSIAVYSNVKRD